MFTVSVTKLQMDRQLAPTRWIKFGLIWFATAFLTLIFATLLLIFISTERVVVQKSHNFKIYSALPYENSLIWEDIEKGDGRPLIIRSFFKQYKAVLSEYSQTFVEVSDKYNLDYRLLPAIAMQESNGGKKVIKNSYNPFGYGIYGDLVISFKGWEEAIERVGKALKEDYIGQGLTTPAKIMVKYTPPSLAKGGAWAKGVSSFMEELR